MAVSAKRPKAAKAARKAKKKTPRRMKQKRQARERPEKRRAAVEKEPPAEAVAVVVTEPKTRLELIRSRHTFMKQEIDQIRVALEEEPED